MGLVFYSQGREGIKKEREEQREYMDVLSPDKKNVISYFGQFFLSSKTHIPNTYFIFFEH